jgi:hypothetical protein
METTMKTTLFSAAVALVTLTAASNAFAGYTSDYERRNDSYQAPSYKQPRYERTGYGSSQYDRPAESDRPTYRPWRDRY